MGNQQQLDLLQQGAGVWNAWRTTQPADFLADLGAVSLETAILDGCDLSRGNLSHGVFWRCSFIGTTLQAADLRWATFFQCSLTQADLRGVDLSHASLIQCSLRGTDLSGAQLSETALIDNKP